jgi:Replication-relaxation
MSAKRSAGRVRPRRASSGPTAARLAAIDRSVLGVLCAHRVVTQDQLGRLFPGVPERTLRYRTRRLHELGLAGRSRPYRDQGSAPNHHWPTRRADCLMRGEPVPRGGERRAPNPLFLAHAAALTELYVALAAEAGQVGLAVQEYRREGEARELFKSAGKERALAPDAMVILIDTYGRKFGAFVEIDLGTMSHTRLRAKAELYAAYAESNAWQERHLFLPALLFLTTTDARATKFRTAFTRALSHGPRRSGRLGFVAGAAGVAWAPGRLLAKACLADLDGNAGLTLTDVLGAARKPYERALTDRREREEADEARRRVLRDDPEAMRRFLAGHVYALASYVQALGAAGEQAVELLRASTGAPSPFERGVLRAIARDLDQALPEPRAHDLPSPGEAVRGEIALLVEDYRAVQSRQVAALADRHGTGPSLHRATDVLGKGGLLDRVTLIQLPADAARDAACRDEQHERQAAYLDWREQAARRLARSAGPLGRLTHHAEDFYPQLDQERLRVCGRCGETIYPPGRATGSFGSADLPSCHYCREPHSTRPYEPNPATHRESEPYR